MVQKRYFLSCVFICFLFGTLIMVSVGKSCKDIIITSAATAGDYSLLLKVRDPSRPGLQVLCRVPKGTLYSYHYPWSGRPWDFVVNHSFIGVATQGDTLPNIVKAGMVLTDAGIAFGDADTLSKWRNPTKNAWDDFDWIRFACQSADNEEEAISLLTTVAVNQLHATGVSENLFLVGPQKAAIIEADAVHVSTRDVSDVLVMSNYPNDLWQTQLVRSVPIASSFDTQKEAWVRRGNVVHLGSVCGIKILSITPSSITSQVFPRFAFQNAGYTQDVNLSLGERATIGPYSLIFLENDGNKARISLCTADYAWEQALLAQIQPVQGNITVQDLLRWSRLHASDIQGLRPMCEEANTYETAMVFKIPKEHATLLSSGWFAANHACSSVYVPIHICDDDLYEPYETGEAAALSLALVQKYGHANLTTLCQGVESVFLFENEVNEGLAHLMIHAELNITSFLTGLDSNMQEQAYLTEQLWLSSPNITRGILQDIWMKNYTTTQQNIRRSISMLQDISGLEATIIILDTIARSISDSQHLRAEILS